VPPYPPHGESSQTRPLSFSAPSCNRGSGQATFWKHLPQQESPELSWFSPGDGPLQQTLYQRALDLGIADRVRFLGFVNQSALPAVYKAADLMVLPSEYEPFGVVVNEASCCGCPVAASDRVGATTDLIAPVNPDFVFPCGDVPALTEILQRAVSDPTELARRGQDSLRRMQFWSAPENITGVLEAVERALSRTRAKRGVP
jgi:glycosyltransferase involved in cell wall biosynthesis